MPKKKTKPTDRWIRKRVIARIATEYSSWIDTDDLEALALIHVGANQSNAADNARRFVVCWNACLDAGLTTQQLEQGVVEVMVDLLRALTNEAAQAVRENANPLQAARNLLKEIKPNGR